MSGLGGHMSHLYENSSMHIGEMKEVFYLVSEGKLESVQEKLDGQNIFFTYNLEDNSLRFARNKTHIKQRGIRAIDIMEKWKDIPSVRDAFYTAYTVLSKGIGALDNDTIVRIFGSSGNIWYSGEIVYSNKPNVINYDRDAFIFHESGAVFDDEGKLIDVDTTENFSALIRSVGFIQHAIASTGWSVMGPVVLQLSSKKNIADKAAGKLNAEVGKYGLDDSNMIADYIAAKFTLIAEQRLKDVTEAQAEEFGRIFGLTGMSPGQKKKAALKILKTKEVATLFLSKNRPSFLKEIIDPLEAIVHNFAVDVLGDVHSVLALHPQREIQRLRSVVSAGIEQIKRTGDESMLEKLGVHLKKLGNVDQITSSLEGIVFKYKGNTYKLTGAFAPSNQILGLLRF